jgi:hypothetical protein
LLGYDQYDYDTEIIYRPTNSGSFIVVIASYSTGGSGTYQLHFLKIPGDLVIPPDDEGGSLGLEQNPTGTINRGDLDPWRFTACRGDLISLRLLTTNFYGRLYLYGPDGAFLTYAQYDYDIGFNYIATNCGTFTAVVSSYSVNGTGTYQLVNNDLSEALKLCPPERTEGNWNLSGVGGQTNDSFVIFTATNMALSFAQWTSLRTNQFDQFGAFTLTNVATGLEAQRYFRMLKR